MGVQQVQTSFSKVYGVETRYIKTVFNGTFDETADAGALPKDVSQISLNSPTSSRQNMSISPNLFEELSPIRLVDAENRPVLYDWLTSEQLDLLMSGAVADELQSWVKKEEDKLGLE